MPDGKGICPRNYIYLMRSGSGKNTVCFQADRSEYKEVLLYERRMSALQCPFEVSGKG